MQKYEYVVEGNHYQPGVFNQVNAPVIIVKILGDGNG